MGAVVTFYTEDVIVKNNDKFRLLEVEGIQPLVHPQASKLSLSPHPKKLK